MAADATAWLRAQPRAMPPRLVPRGVPLSNPDRRFAELTRRPQTDPRTRIERTGGIRRAPGVSDGSFTSDTGRVEWYVPEGAEFDTEQARGYNAGAGDERGSWRHDLEQLTDYELEQLTASYPEEHSDWADYAVAPIRPTIRAGGWIDRDWTGYAEPEVDEWVDYLTERAHWAYTEAGNPIDDRIAVLRDAYDHGRDYRVPPPPTHEGPTKARSDAGRAMAAAQAPQAVKRPKPKPAPALPLQTAGLETDEMGRVTQAAWEAYWDRA